MYLLDVEQGHEPVLALNVIVQALQALDVAGRHKGRVGDEVHQQFNAGLAVEHTGVIGAVGIELLDLFGRGTKSCDVSSPTSSAISTLAPSSVHG